MKTYLSSGDNPGEANGFMDGQAYADALAEAGLGDADLPILAAVMDKLQAAEGYDELRKGLLELYRGEPPPDALGATLQNLLVLGELAGRVAVLEDA